MVSRPFIDRFTQTLLLFAELMLLQPAVQVFGDFIAVFILKEEVLVAMNADFRQVDDCAVATCGIVGFGKGVAGTRIFCHMAVALIFGSPLSM